MQTKTPSFVDLLKQDIDNAMEQGSCSPVAGIDDLKIVDNAYYEDDEFGDNYGYDLVYANTFIESFDTIEQTAEHILGILAGSFELISAATDTIDLAN